MSQTIVPNGDGTDEMTQETDAVTKEAGNVNETGAIDIPEEGTASKNPVIVVVIVALFLSGTVFDIVWMKKKRHY